MTSLRCVIVDDDEIDQLMVVSMVKRFPVLDCVGVFSDAFQARSFCTENRVDVLFLDIDMPEFNGLDLRRQLADIPVCVFISAHPEHAVESFELETFDFLVKPIKFERFSKTVDRIQSYFELCTKATLYQTNLGSEFVYIKEGHQKTKINLRDILYVEGLKDYTLVVTSKKRHCVLSSIGNLLKEENFKNFVRVHRSYAVARHQVKVIESNEIKMENDVRIPIGRIYKTQIGLL